MSRNDFMLAKNDLYATLLSPRLKPGLNKWHFKASCVSSSQAPVHLYVCNVPEAIRGHVVNNIKLLQ